MAGLPIKECTMRIRLTCVAPLLVAGAAVVAVTAAPDCRRGSRLGSG